MDMSKDVLLAAEEKLSEIAQVYESMWDMSKQTNRTASDVQDTPGTVRAIKLAAHVLRLAAASSDGFDALWKERAPDANSGHEYKKCKWWFLEGELATRTKCERRIAELEADLRTLCAEVRRCWDIADYYNKPWDPTFHYSCKEIMDDRPPRVQEILDANAKEPTT